MGRQPTSLTQISICIVAAVLLIALAGMQYRWATKVAAADVQREKEHLNSAATLFANEFNAIAGAASSFLETQAWPSMRSGGPVPGVPKLIGELYFLDFSAAAPSARRLGRDGLFVPVAFPAWIPIKRCGPLAIDEPSAFMAAVYDVTEPGAGNHAGTQRAFQWRPDRCFVARIDEGYLTRTLFPELIRGTFGQMAASEYDFSVASSSQARLLIFGRPSRVDFGKAFFSLRSEPPPDPAVPGAPPARSAVRVRRMETVVSNVPGMADLYGPGIWQLQIARKGAPLEEAFEGVRNRSLWLSAGVELLLLTAIVFLVMGTRRLQVAADQKLRFVAGVSHELRTPASSIAMLSRNLADGLVTAPRKVKQYGELIHQQSGRLNEMVEQVLQYASVQAQVRPARQRVDVDNLIQETLAARSEELASAGFQVETAVTPDLPAIFGNPRLLRTALDNLLTNARKHADAGRWIRVSADYSEREKRVRIRVEDRGGGIDPEDRADVFEPFCRGQRAVEAQIPGSGLGLSLVRRAAEVHHGVVTLESQPGRGCTFTMHLPV
jgi:signal transduction histidine kinase